MPTVVVARLHPRESVVTGDYCRAVERHLCQKNDGHLIRIVGPAFDLVSQWERDSVPLKVALRGIDRYFERSERGRPRRRPVRIEFCKADVQDVFDEWRRALGLTRAAMPGIAGAPSEPHGEASGSLPALVTGAGDVEGDEAVEASPSSRRGPSLRAHLERAAVRLSSARATGRIGEAADVVLERLSTELDLARARAATLRGESRQNLLDRLVVLDRELGEVALATLETDERTAIEAEARQELLPFRIGMAPEMYERSLRRAIDRLVRERTALPVLVYPA